MKTYYEASKNGDGLKKRLILHFVDMSYISFTFDTEKETMDTLHRLEADACAENRRAFSNVQDTIINMDNITYMEVQDA